MVDKVKQGKKNRANGSAFELRVRKDLESKGWTVDKWSNNVEIVKSPKEDGEMLIIPEECKLVPAKRKYLGPGRPMAIGTGFPDFIAFKHEEEIFIEDEGTTYEASNYTVIGVECKTNGYLDKEEKEKCKWLLDNNVFSKILIAEKTKVKNKIVIVYHDFEKKYE